MPNTMKMEVDNPMTLKRCSSAPIINELNSAMSTSTPSVPTSR